MDISTQFPDCPVRNILSRVSDKWSLLVMHQLIHSPAPMRFSALQKAIPDISQKMLTATLRNLEADGFILRTANKFFAMPDGAENLEASGAALMSGIKLNNQFLGTGYNDRIHMFGDFGSAIYTIEKL